MKKIISVAAVFAAVLTIAGCNLLQSSDTTPPASDTSVTTPTTSAVTPAAGSSESFKQLVDKLNTAKLAFVEESQADGVKRMTNAALIKASTRYVLQGGNKSVTVSVAETANEADAATVKKEIEGQMALLKELSPESTSKFLYVGSPTLVVTLTYDKGDEDTAGKAETALIELQSEDRSKN